MDKASIPPGYRIYEMEKDWLIPERWDKERSMWRSFDKGRNSYYSYKTWDGALAFILRKEAERQVREQEG